MADAFSDYYRLIGPFLLTPAIAARDVWNLRGYAVNLTMLITVLAERIVSGQYVLIIIDPIYKFMR